MQGKGIDKSDSRVMCLSDESLLFSSLILDIFILKINILTISVRS